MLNFKSVIVAFAVAVSVSLIFLPDIPIEEKPRVQLNDKSYDVTLIQSPIATGTFLEYLSWLISQSRFGPFLRRVLLNKNHLFMLRELAHQIEEPPLFQPIKRNSLSEPVADDDAINSVLHYSAPTESNSQLNKRRRFIHDYVAQYLSNAMKPSQVMKKTLIKVQEFEAQGLRIFSSINETDVMHQAKLSDLRYEKNEPLSVLDGVPVVIKDMVNVMNHIVYDGRNPNFEFNHIVCLDDDVIVQRLRKLGAIIFGVTIMVEGGVTPLGYNAHFQGPHSAFSSRHYSGGSSSGCAVAVATGLVPLAVGFDGGGSIRLPATMSGIHGNEELVIYSANTISQQNYSTVRSRSDLGSYSLG
jgi:hypothetical protein